MKEKGFKCVCGFNTGNKGRYIQHVQECERYKGSSPLQKKISRMVSNTEKDIQDENIGLGHTTRTSYCCDAPMIFDKKIGVMVCKKCGKSPWENSGMPTGEKTRRKYLRSGF